MSAAELGESRKHEDTGTRKHLLVSVFPCFLLFLGVLVVYVRTAAPSVMGGDSAEFQMAAPLLGVPHPTTYPLYILVGKLFTALLPFGDLAWRVTLVSAFSAALAVALLFVMARRITGSTLAALLAALAFATAPGLWNAATMAEVYAMLAALIAATWLGLAMLQRSSKVQKTRRQEGQKIIWLAWFIAFLSGLGVSHHGLFVFTMLPVVAINLLYYSFTPSSASNGQRIPDNGQILRRMLICAGGFVVGLTPWLFPLLQYARFGPFSSEDYGLPRHYFWGAPTTWAEALGMVSGGPMRAGVFRIPTTIEALTVLRLLAERLWFEFGPLGIALGVLGTVALFRRNRRQWFASSLVAGGTLVYLLLLGPAVQDAPIFTLPLLLPWALWVGTGGWACARMLRNRNTETRKHEAKTGFRVSMSSCFQILLIAATLAWGYTRLPYTNKHHLNLWREWGEPTLAQLPANAVVIAHWEQGMVLQYIVQAEHQRPDVWIDVVEPSDDAWKPRATRRYANRPVFFVGTTDDVATIRVAEVRHDTYASLFAWQGP